ncbi:hypothetical protein BDZ89DRAFT_1153915 [Hymenopellis radicata]|nr:hypothetical protein BDZ89DRAFT_1153915 [Hymenopellis radicata]
MPESAPRFLMDAKLKALKVADLKAILAAAGVPLPSKANKADLIAAIIASEPALEAYHALHGSEHSEPVTKAEAVKELSKPPVAKPVSEKSKSPAKAPVKEQPAPAAPVTATTQAAVSAPSTVAEPSSDSLDSEEAKRKMRAERFGIPLVDPSSIIKSPPKRKRVAPTTGDDAEKIQKRGEKFGTTQQATSLQKAAAKRKQPVEEVVDDEELARRKKRAERFGPVKS